MPSTKITYHHLLIHALCWLVYIAYEQLAVYIVSVNYQFSDQASLFYALNITIFYAQLVLLNHTFAGEKPRYIATAGMIIVLIFVITCLKIIGEFWLSAGRAFFWKDPKLLRQIIILDVVRSVFYGLAGSSYWLILRNFRLRKKSEEVRHAFLEQQIKPHLLFNTLNFVYSTVYKHSLKGARAIKLLTELLDFSLQPGPNNSKTLLVDEIQQIQNLIELNGLRFDYTLGVEFRIEGNPDSHRIIPLVLLTLVENIFVHGYFRNESAVIALDISPAGIINFETVNTSLSRPSKHSRGSGLSNIRTRLAYAYPNRFELHTERLGKLFTTKLRIEL